MLIFCLLSFKSSCRVFKCLLNTIYTLRMFFLLLLGDFNFGIHWNTMSKTMEQLPCFFLDQLRCCLLVTNNEKLLLASIISANIYPFKVSKINNRKSCKICSKLTVKHQNDVVLVFSLLTLNRFLTFFRCQNLRATNSVDVI